MKKVSIITVVKNGMPDLKNAIKSFDNQNFINKEHIIVYSKSYDNTEKYLETVRSDSRIIIRDNNTGNKFDAINIGIKFSKGDLIGLLHADDEFYDNNVLSNVEIKFRENINYLYGNILIISKKEKIIRKWRSDKFSKKKLEFGWMPPHTSTFIEKKFSSQIGNYSNSFKISSDYDYMLRCLKHKNLNIGYLDKYITKMKFGGDSTRILSLFKKMKEDFLIQKKNKLKFPLFSLIFKNLRKINQFIN